MKKIIYGMGIFVAVIMLSGCGNAIPEMTPEERNMVVNYAADIVQKYNENNPNRLQNVELLYDENSHGTENMGNQENTSQGQEPSAESTAMSTEEKETDGPEVTDNASGGEKEQDAMPEATLNSFLGMEAFDFSYVGYETADSYPPSEGENVFFAMNATDGMKLLLLKFSARNTSAEEAMLDMAGLGVQFKVRVNGETMNAMTTMLLNDFALYQGSVEAGTSCELVVVCEIPEEQAGKIKTLSLRAKNNEAGITISLEN